MGKNTNKKRKRSLASDEGPVTKTTGDIRSAFRPGSITPSPTYSTPSTGKATTDQNNPLLEQQAKFFAKSGLKDYERHEFFSPKIPSDRRAKLWMDQVDVGEDLVNRYAWATPNSTAIRILKEFSPLVEIGCGSNAYWCRILQQTGVDIVGYDVNVTAGGKIEGSTNSMKKANQINRPSFLKKGGPEVLASKELRESGRTLFLCYPDEDDEEGGSHNVDSEEDDELPSSMGWQCLHNYTGDHVIHVGETFLDSNYGMEQAPWGRSSSPEFQQRLSSEYHCILKVELPNWFHTRDTISVWKRSEISTIVFAAEDDEDDDTDEEVEYRHIPIEERLPVNIAAPCLAHLLPGQSSGETKVDNWKESPKSTNNPLKQGSGTTPPTSSKKKKKKKKKNNGATD
jgi:hypothetical protein